MRSNTPLLAKAVLQFAEPKTRHERIRAVDDEILLKVKVQRWRGPSGAKIRAPLNAHG